MVRGQQKQKQKRAKRKSCVKKKRVISSIPGSRDVVVFCAHGCGISYTTPPQHLDKLVWHKTIRKLNAHESQRCPKNEERTRCPRKHPKVRASSTANPCVPAPSLATWTPPLPGAQKPTTLGAVMEAAELKSRLGEDAEIAAKPANEREVATGVYWTKPIVHNERRHLVLKLLDQEQRERCAEPLREQIQRRNRAIRFTKRIFPEFLATLQELRRGKASPFWMKSEHLSLASPVRSYRKKTSRRKTLYGQIDIPNALTMKDSSWGIGQQVFVHSRADGGKLTAHIVGVGGFQGSSVLVQFESKKGFLKQQLHHAAGVASGSRIHGCVFDETSKLSDFKIDQGHAISSSAGSGGLKLASMPCENALCKLDDDFDLFNVLDTPAKYSTSDFAVLDLDDDARSIASLGSLASLGDLAFGGLDLEDACDTDGCADSHQLQLPNDLDDIEQYLTKPRAWSRYGSLADLAKPKAARSDSLSSLSSLNGLSNFEFDACVPDSLLTRFDDPDLYEVGSRFRRPSLTTVAI